MLVADAHVNKSVIYETLRRAFNTVDKSKDGLLSVDNIRPVLATLGFNTSSNERLLDLIRDAYIESSGKIAYADLDAVLTSDIAATLTTSLRRTFDFIDADCDGYVNGNDIHTLLVNIGEVWSDADLRDVITTADRDHDGKIGIKDFCLFMGHTGDDIEDCSDHEDDVAFVERSISVSECRERLEEDCARGRAVSRNTLEQSGHSTRVDHDALDFNDGIEHRPDVNEQKSASDAKTMVDDGWMNHASSRVSVRNIFGNTVDNDNVESSTAVSEIADVSTINRNSIESTVVDDERMENNEMHCLTVRNSLCGTTWCVDSRLLDLDDGIGGDEQATTKPTQPENNDSETGKSTDIPNTRVKSYEKSDSSGVNNSAQPCQSNVGHVEFQKTTVKNTWEKCEIKSDVPDGSNRDIFGSYLTIEKAEINNTVNHAEINQGAHDTDQSLRELPSKNCDVNIPYNDLDNRKNLKSSVCDVYEGLRPENGIIRNSDTATDSLDLMSGGVAFSEIESHSTSAFKSSLTTNTSVPVSPDGDETTEEKYYGSVRTISSADSAAVGMRLRCQTNINTTQPQQNIFESSSSVCSLSSRGKIYEDCSEKQEYKTCVEDKNMCCSLEELVQNIVIRKRVIRLKSNIGKYPITVKTTEPLSNAHGKSLFRKNSVTRLSRLDLHHLTKRPSKENLLRRNSKEGLISWTKSIEKLACGKSDEYLETGETVISRERCKTSLFSTGTQSRPKDKELIRRYSTTKLLFLRRDSKECLLQKYATDGNFTDPLQKASNDSLITRKNTKERLLLRRNSKIDVLGRTGKLCINADKLPQSDDCNNLLIENRDDLIPNECKMDSSAQQVPKQSISTQDKNNLRLKEVKGQDSAPHILMRRHSQEKLKKLSSLLRRCNRQEDTRVQSLSTTINKRNIENTGEFPKLLKRTFAEIVTNMSGTTSVDMKQLANATARKLIEEPIKTDVTPPGRCTNRRLKSADKRRNSLKNTARIILTINSLQSNVDKKLDDGQILQSLQKQQFYQLENRADKRCTSAPLRRELCPPVEISSRPVSCNSMCNPRSKISLDNIISVVGKSALVQL